MAVRIVDVMPSALAKTQELADKAMGYIGGNKYLAGALDKLGTGYAGSMSYDEVTQIPNADCLVLCDTATFYMQ